MNQPDNWAREKAWLLRSGASLQRGLSERELLAAESKCGARFPPALVSFLMATLPVGQGFPNWRILDDPSLQNAIDRPFEGIAFDIDRNSFWLPAWGARPDDLKSATRLALEAVEAAPSLVPIYSHRYLPAGPSEAGNPVLSVQQTDIIYYGRDIRSYFAHEFGGVSYAQAITP